MEKGAVCYLHYDSNLIAEARFSNQRPLGSVRNRSKSRRGEIRDTHIDKPWRFRASDLNEWFNRK